MKRSLTLLTWAALGLVACGDTPISTTDQLSCTELSSEVLADLDAVPDGFDGSPRGLIDGVLGSYAGFQLDEFEQETTDQAWATIADLGSDVSLTRFASNIDDSSELASDPCPPRLTTTLAATLAMDGVPSLDGVLATRLGPDGEFSLTATDSPDFDGELPSPKSFDPTAYELVESQVALSGGDGALWAKVRWEASNPSEAADEPDGDYTILSELVGWASLTLVSEGR